MKEYIHKALDVTGQHLSVVFMEELRCARHETQEVVDGVRQHKRCRVNYV